MAISKNIDRYLLDETLDLTPRHVVSAFQSANQGHTLKQSRIANELLQKDASIGQAWSVREAAISSAPWEIVGSTEERNNWVKRSLENIQPSIQSGLSSFYELLGFLQSAQLQGFSLSAINWNEGRASIRGFENYAQSLFSFCDSNLPYFQGNVYLNDTKIDDKKVYPKYPEWIYHTSNNSRQTEPLRAGLVRPLAFLYCFNRTITIEYLRGLEKYGLPMPAVSFDRSMIDDEDDEKRALQEFMEHMTYDGFMLYERDKMELTFPNAGVFNADDFATFLDRNERQIFRLILGQDSTSSAENSNRSTAQVHNLVRQDILSSDARSIEETVNNQIIKPLFEANFGPNEIRPKFRFRLKNNSELKEMAEIVKMMKESGYKLTIEDLSEKFGMRITEIEAVVNDN